MFKKILSIMLAGMLLYACVAVNSAGVQRANGQSGAPAQLSTEAQASDKVKVKVQRMGIGRDARVEVKLRNNTKVKGYISAAGEDSFTVTDRKTGAAQTIALADALEVRKQGGGLSTRSWIIIGGAAAAIVIVGLTVIRPVLCDGC